MVDPDTAFSAQTVISNIEGGDKGKKRNSQVKSVASGPGWRQVSELEY